MKKIEEIKNVLIQNRALIKQRFKIDIIGIFGSYIRGQANDNSDIDILIKIDESADLIDLCGAANYLEEMLQITVDVVPIDAIREELKDFIFKDIYYI